jgi:hypothetical protein
MNSEAPLWPRPRKRSGYALGTPERPVGMVIAPPPPGASTVARCKTCGPALPPPVDPPRPS